MFSAHLARQKAPSLDGRYVRVGDGGDQFAASREIIFFGDLYVKTTYSQCTPQLLL